MSDKLDPKVEIKTEEKPYLLDHNYDDIHELDYPLPRWWIFIFYATIVFAVGYVGYYMLGPGPSLKQELDSALAAVYAKRPKEAPVVVDEKALTAQVSNVDHVKLGAKVFASRCTPCHGPAGQGGIGPNLTDDFWIHGTGSLPDIAKTVHDGVTEKGMPAWSEVLQPNEVQDVAVFVRSLRGTTPANPKAPQGTVQKATQVSGKS